MQNVQKRLTEIQAAVKKYRGNPKFRVQRLFKLLTQNLDLLVLGYEQIKSNKGATTEVDRESLDGTSKEKLETCRKQLENRSWKPKPRKVTMIPKPRDPSSKRPIRVQNPEAKIVQSAVNLLLTTIYEDGGIFRKSISFGWMKGLSCHRALKRIEEQFKRVDWLIEGDIKSFFPTINHNLLISLLERRIDDPKFMRLMKALIKGSMKIEREIVPTKLRIPQGSILSPVLANVILHELDLSVTEMAESVNEEWTPKAKAKAIHREYARQSRLRGRIRKELKSLSGRMRWKTNSKRAISKKKLEHRKALVRQLKKLEEVKTSLPYYDLSKKPHRMVYVRYADDFLIRISRPKSRAVEIKNDVGGVIERIKLIMSPVKTKISNAKSDKIIFLRHRIRVRQKNSRKKVIRQGRRGDAKFPARKKKWLIRAGSRTVKIYPNWDELLRRLEEQGFYNISTRRSKCKQLWALQSSAEIIDEYRWKYNGLMEYYSGANGQSGLRHLWYILSSSCLLTLAYRHKISVQKAAKRFKTKNQFISVESTNEKTGKSVKVVLKNLTRTEGDREWAEGSAKDFCELWNFRMKRLTLSKVYAPHCCICGSNEGVEMHHVKSLGKRFRARFGKRSKRAMFLDSMIALNRKQIPLCTKKERSCHKKVHDGKYDRIPLKELFASLYDKDLASR